MAKKIEKLLSLILALSMVMSLLTVGVSATGEGEGETAPTSGDYIVNAGGEKYYDALGNEVAKDSANHFVTVGKTVSGTNTENVFDITLSVETKEKTDYYEFVKDSAVVLTIDFSNTMTENNIGSKTRLAVALEKAQEFVASYGEAGETAGAKRYLAVVAFSSPGQTYIDWIDVSNSGNRSTVLSQIASMANNSFWKKYGSGGTAYRGGATNMEAGLQLTYDLLTASDKPSTDRNYAILLSDGSPTMHIDVDGHKYDVAGDYYYYCNCNGSSTCLSRNDKTGSDVNGVDHIRAKAVADKIKALSNTELYAIAVAASAWLDSEKVGSETAATWLANKIASSSSKMIRADDAAGVTSAFGSINTAIQTETIPEKTSIKAGTVTDVLPANIELVSLPAGATANGQTITWDIDSAEKGPFTLTYRVRLKTEAAGYAAGANYPTNASATLTYNVVNDGVVDPAGKTATFAVPAVEGLAGAFSFTKVNSDEAPLAGAQFALKQGDEVICTSNVSGEDGVIRFDAVPSGHTYSLVEIQTPDGYGTGAAISVDVSWGNVTINGAAVPADMKVVNSKLNSLTVAKTVSVVNEGAAANNRLTAEALADVSFSFTVTGPNNYSASFTLKANESKTLTGLVDGVYYVTEVEPSVPNGFTGYSVEVSGTGNVPLSDGANITKTVTNAYKHTPETVDVAVSKIWDDADNQDGKRPASITYNLVANEVVSDSKTVTVNDNWAASWTDFAKYDADGNEIVYTVTEDEVPGYTSKVEAAAGTAPSANVKAFVATNSHTPETVSVSGTKTWNDENDADGLRPDSITVNLLADGVEIDEKTVTAANGWAYSFSGLAKYKNGVAIVYTVTEDDVANYESSVSGYNITNNYTPGKKTFTVTKVWNDADNQDGIRPASISVQLYANGQASGDPVILNAANNWSYQWTGLNIKANGQAISYTVDEVNDAGESTVPSGYEKKVEGNTITNTHVPEETSVTVTKVWDDSARGREQAVEIQLYANGAACGDPVTLNGNWTYTWTGLAKKANGVAISYTVNETPLGEYWYKDVAPAEDAENSWIITNSYNKPVVPQYTSVTVNKVWVDDNDALALRPDSISVQLYANGNAYGAPVTLSEGNWTYTWTGLALGVNYTVDEVSVPAGYEKSVSGYTITNTLVEETLEEEEPPMSDLPEEEFEEEDVPLADVPATGDATVIWAAVSAVSAAGLFVLGKKNKDEE